MLERDVLVMPFICGLDRPVNGRFEVALKGRHVSLALGLNELT